VIVTSDRRGFTEGIPSGLHVQTPDEFLLDALDLAPALVLGAVTAVAARTGRHGPARTSREILERLRAISAPVFATAALDRLEGAL
jgi:hypothetical protein